MPPIGPRADARKRAERAYELRCQGRTWDSIATELQYGSHRSAFNAVRKHIERLPTEDQDLARAFSAGTYKLVVARLFEVAEMAQRQGKPHTAVMALDSAAQATAKHDALQGLNVAVPTKVDIQVTSRVAVLDRAEEQLMAIAQRRPNVIDAEILP